MFKLIQAGLQGTLALWSVYSCVSTYSTEPFSSGSWFVLAIWNFMNMIDTLFFDRAFKEDV